MQTPYVFHSPWGKLLSFVLILSLNACTLYKKIEFQADNQSSWEEIVYTEAQRGADLSSRMPMNGADEGRKSRYEAIRILEKQSPNLTYSRFELTDYTISGDKIEGNLTLNLGLSMPGSDSFWEKLVDKDMRRPIRKSLFITTDQDLIEGPIQIQLGQVQQFTRYKISDGVTVLSTVGILVGGTLALAVAVCNCPRVYATEADGSQRLQGTFLSGAIAQSLERQDLLPLPHLNREASEITLTVANELPEDEFLNHISLLKVPHRRAYNLAHDASGSLFEYRSPLMPTAALSKNESDVLAAVRAEDELAYGFEEEIEDEQLNTLILHFDKTQLSDQTSKLLIHARQTEWLEQVTESLFQLYGTDFDKLNQRMDKAPRRFFEAYIAKRGISMKAYLKTKKGWKEIGVFQNAGILKQKWLGMDLDLSKVEGNEIQIKLEAAFGLWEIDQVGIVQDWQTVDQYEEVPLISATNQSGEDVRALIQTEDDQYAHQPNIGDHIQLTFENTAGSDELYVLQGTGYYRHVRDYSHAPHKQAIRELRSLGKLGAHKLSLLLHAQSRLMTENQVEATPQSGD